MFVSPLFHLLNRTFFFSKPCKHMDKLLVVDNTETLIFAKLLALVETKLPLTWYLNSDLYC